MNAPAPHDSASQKRRRRARNIALFLSLLAFVALVYGITIVKIKAGYGP